MNIKIHKDFNFKIAIFIFLLIDCRFFYLVEFPGMLGGASSNKFMLAVTSIVIFTFFVVCKRNLNLGRYKNVILMFYVILLLNIFNMKIKWGYRNTQILWFCIPYCILLMYFVVREYLKKENNYKVFVNIAEVFCIIVGILMIIQVAYWNVNHKLFLFVNVNDYYLYHYNVNLRLYGYCDGLMRITLPLSIYEIIYSNFKFKNNKIHYISAFIIFISILYVDQSRIYLIIELVALFVMYITFKEKKLKVNRKRFIFLVILAIIAIYILRNNVISVFSSLFDLRNGSRYARVGAISHFIESWTDWFFSGYGIVIPDEQTKAYSIIKGNMGIYNYDDIGIFGVAVSLGIFAFVWYLYVLFSLWKMSKAKTKYHSLNKGIFTVFLLSMFTQSYLDNGRIISMMLTLAIVECLSANFRMEVKV